MFIVVSTSKEFEMPGEYESIDAAIQAIKDRAGLYASSVKEERRYETESRGSIAIVSLFGERFVVREKNMEAQKPQKAKKQRNKTTDVERDEKARAILADAANTPAGKTRYAIFEKWPSGKRRDHYAEEIRLSGCGVQFDGYAFLSASLARLVLAWFAMVCARERHCEDRAILRREFDKTLQTGRCGRFAVEAIDDDDVWYDEVVDPAKVSVPPFVEGLEDIIEKCW